MEDQVMRNKLKEKELIAQQAREATENAIVETASRFSSSSRHRRGSDETSFSQDSNRFLAQNDQRRGLGVADTSLVTVADGRNLRPPQDVPQPSSWGTMKIVRPDPASQEYDLEGNAVRVAQAMALSAHDKLRVAMAVRLQKILKRVNTTLTNAGLDIDLTADTVHPIDNEMRLQELENRLVLSSQLKAYGTDTVEKLGILEEVCLWLDTAQVQTLLDTCSSAVLAKEGQEIGGIVKRINEAMINTINTVSKMKRLGYKMMKLTGITGWREQLKLCHPPFLVTEELLGADYGSNINNAFSVTSTCLSELNKLTINPVSRKWLHTLTSQMHAITVCTSNRFADLEFYERQHRGSREKAITYMTKLSIAQMQSSRLGQHIEELEAKNAELEEDLRQRDSKLKMATDKTLYLESLIYKLKREGENIQRLLSKEKSCEIEMMQMKKALDNVMARSSLLSTSMTDEGSDNLSGGVRRDSASQTMTEMVSGGDIDMISSQMQVQQTTLKRLNNDLVTWKNTSKWKSKVIERLKDRIVKTEGPTGTNFYQKTMKELREAEPLDSNASALNRVASLQNQLDILTEDNRVCQEKVMKDVAELSSLNQSLNEREENITTMHSYLLRRFSGLLDGTKKHSPKSYNAKYEDTMNIINEVDRMLCNIAYISPQLAPFILTQDGRAMSSVYRPHDPETSSKPFRKSSSPTSMKLLQPRKYSRRSSFTGQGYNTHSPYNTSSKASYFSKTSKAVFERRRTLKKLNNFKDVVLSLLPDSKFAQSSTVGSVQEIASQAVKSWKNKIKGKVKFDTTNHQPNPEPDIRTPSPTARLSMSPSQANIHVTPGTHSNLFTSMPAPSEMSSTFVQRSPINIERDRLNVEEAHNHEKNVLPNRLQVPAHVVTEPEYSHTSLTDSHTHVASAYSPGEPIGAARAHTSVSRTLSFSTEGALVPKLKSSTHLAERIVHVHTVDTDQSSTQSHTLVSTQKLSTGSIKDFAAGAPAINVQSPAHDTQLLISRTGQQPGSPQTIQDLPNQQTRRSLAAAKSTTVRKSSTADTLPTYLPRRRSSATPHKSQLNINIPVIRFSGSNLTDTAPSRKSSVSPQVLQMFNTTVTRPSVIVVHSKSENIVHEVAPIETTRLSLSDGRISSKPTHANLMKSLYSNPPKYDDDSGRDTMAPTSHSLDKSEKRASRDAATNETPNMSSLKTDHLKNQQVNEKFERLNEKPSSPNNKTSLKTDEPKRQLATERSRTTSTSGKSPGRFYNISKKVAALNRQTPVSLKRRSSKEGVAKHRTSANWGKTKRNSGSALKKRGTATQAVCQGNDQSIQCLLAQRSNFKQDQMVSTSPSLLAGIDSAISTAQDLSVDSRPRKVQSAGLPAVSHFSAYPHRKSTSTPVFKKLPEGSLAVEDTKSIYGLFGSRALKRPLSVLLPNIVESTAKTLATNQSRATSPFTSRSLINQDYGSYGVLTGESLQYKHMSAVSLQRPTIPRILADGESQTEPPPSQQADPKIHGTESFTGGKLGSVDEALNNLDLLYHHIEAGMSADILDQYTALLHIIKLGWRSWKAQHAVTSGSRIDVRAATPSSDHVDISINRAESGEVKHTAQQKSLSQIVTGSAVLRSVAVQSDDRFLDTEMKYDELLADYEVIRSALNSGMSELIVIQQGVKEALSKLDTELQVADISKQVSLFRRLYEVHKGLIYQLQQGLESVKGSEKVTCLHKGASGYKISNGSGHWRGHCVTAVHSGNVQQMPNLAGSKIRRSSKASMNIGVNEYIDLPGRQVADEIDKLLEGQKLLHSTKEKEFSSIISSVESAKHQIEQLLGAVITRIESLKQTTGSGPEGDIQSLNVYQPLPPIGATDKLLYSTPVPSPLAELDSEVDRVGIHRVPQYDEHKDTFSAKARYKQSGPAIKRNLEQTSELPNRIWSPVVSRRMSTHPYWKHRQPPVCKTTEEWELRTEARIYEAEIASLKRPENWKGLKHKRRLATVRGYCINELSASLPITTNKKRPAAVRDECTTSPYDCIKPRSQQKTKNIKMTVPDVNFIEY